MPKTKIVIGTRGSELALWQAHHIKKTLLKSVKSVSVEIKIIKTKGDKILNTALSQIGDKGLFTKELEEALLKGEIDLAVHSLKDLQTLIPEGLALGAVTKRHEVEDVLIARKKNMTIFDLPENGIVATGSLRRKAQLLHLRPDLRIVELRGNVPTRIQKFLDSKWDAIILARAGVERLKLKKHISSYIPIEQMVPAVGQGALGIEINDSNDSLKEILLGIHDESTYYAVSAERAFLKKLEGGCQVPIGAFGQVTANGLYLDGLVASVEGDISFRKKIKGSKKDPESLGVKLAEELLAAGAGEIL